MVICRCAQRGGFSRSVVGVVEYLAKDSPVPVQAFQVHVSEK